jgi:hypothetical protein
MPERSEGGEDRVSEQEEAAAREAGAIGGRDPDPGVDPERRAVEEAGGGEAEGFEQAERDLEGQASHADSPRNPRYDEFSESEEPEAADAEYGEADSAHEPDD